MMLSWSLVNFFPFYLDSKEKYPRIGFLMSGAEDKI
jgi:hypothetical protein